jgi:glycosyltransferase involved in cell wall biosynthesis
LGNDALLKKYSGKSYGLYVLLKFFYVRIRFLLTSKEYDLVWIEKEALPWLPVFFEKWLLRKVRYVLDFDDAIFHNYDLNRNLFVRWIFRRRIDLLMENAHLVIAGNTYLANRAISSGARCVEVVPSVIDVEKYPVKQKYTVATKIRVVWIGSPSTSKYLDELVKPLSELGIRHQFILRLVGCAAINIPGVEVEVVSWSADTEAASISECDIGIMPLHDTPWEQGKCAYKLIQYMACGLPTVSSPIGANRDVVIAGKTGFFAQNSQEWIEKLELLLCNAVVRQCLGQAGRARVKAYYCVQETAPKMVRLLVDAGGQ